MVDYFDFCVTVTGIKSTKKTTKKRDFYAKSAVGYLAVFDNESIF